MNFLSDRFPELTKFITAEQMYQNRDVYPSALGKAIFQSDIPSNFLPVSRPVFKLSYFLIPLDEEDSLYFPQRTEMLNHFLLESKNGKDFAVFFIHPLTEAQFLEWDHGKHEFVPADASDFVASPTSSPRSLIVYNQKKQFPIWVKISLLNNIANGSRHIDWYSAMGQVESCQALINSGWNDSRLQFINDVGCLRLRLPEPIELPSSLNISFGSNTIQDFGMVVREIPRDLLSNDFGLISIAAASSPKRHPVSALVNWAEQSDSDFVEFIEEGYVTPIIECFSDIYYKVGILLEPHSQNLLIVTNKNGFPTGRFYYRDFDMTYFDRLRFPLKCGPAWLQHLKDRPDRISSNANHETRRGIMQTFHHHIIDNTVQTLVLAGQTAGLFGSKFVTDFMNFIDFQWKQFLFARFPSSDLSYVLGKNIKYNINALNYVSLWEYPFKIDRTIPDQRSATEIVFSDEDPTHCLVDDYGRELSIDLNFNILKISVSGGKN